jgi:hypothetical protein
VAVLTYSQVYALAREAGLNPAAAVIATAIAKAESGLRTDVEGDVGIQTDKWGPSIGLWQIRSVKAEWGRGTSRDGSRLKDPAFNARSMVEISGGGTNWRPWSVFLHDSYRKFLPEVQPAGAAAEAQAAALGLVPGGRSPWGSLAGVSSSDFAGVSASGSGGVTETEGLLDRLNPFDDWQNTALKLVVGAAALGLVVAGAIKTVSNNDRSST